MGPSVDPWREFVSNKAANAKTDASAGSGPRANPRVGASLGLGVRLGVPRAESERGRVEIGLTLAGGPKANSDDLSDERVMDGLHTHKITTTTVNLLPAELKSRQVPGS